MRFRSNRCRIGFLDSGSRKRGGCLSKKIALPSSGRASNWVQIPPRLSQVGDIVFEKSRARAQVALERFQLDAKKRCKAEELIQTIHEIRTGERIRSPDRHRCAVEGTAAAASAQRSLRNPG